MTVVETIDRLSEWVEKNIAQKILLKQPPSAELNPTTRIKEPITHGVKFVHPVVFPLFIPAKDKMKVEVSPPVPSICVQPADCSDDIVNQKRYMTVQLSLACYNPGYQSDEIFVPHEDLLQDIPRAYKQGADIQQYKRNFDGWRDIWNFLDVVLRELEGVESLSGFAVLMDEPIDYGLFEDYKNAEDYPYWHAYVKFRLVSGLVRAVPGKRLQNL